MRAQARMAIKGGWSKRFDEPIMLDDGTKLTTLRDAIQYLGRTVPKAERDHPTVTVAADHLKGFLPLAIPAGRSQQRQLVGVTNGA
jgi:uncharacterized protein YvpB